MCGGLAVRLAPMYILVYYEEKKVENEKTYLKHAQECNRYHKAGIMQKTTLCYTSIEMFARYKLSVHIIHYILARGGEGRKIATNLRQRKT